MDWRKGRNIRLKKIVDFAKSNSHKDADIKVQTLSDVTHLSIIKNSSNFIGEWISEQVNQI